MAIMSKGDYMTITPPPLDPWSLLFQGAAIAATNSAQIQSLWDRAWAAMTRSNSKIVVTGLPGVGKSVLFDHIAGRAGAVGYSLPDKSRVAEKERLKQGRQRWVVTIVPGQETPVRAETLDEAFKRGKRVDGVIYVVANGYASLRQLAAEQALVESGLTLDEYLDERRSAEVADFEDVCAAGIRQAMRRKRNRSHNPWILIAVNKSDLFCGEAEIREAYRRYAEPGGEFYLAVERLLDAVGHDNFRFEVHPVASWAQDFNFGKQVAKSTMPLTTRNESLLNLVRVMTALCEGV